MHHIVVKASQCQSSTALFFSANICVVGSTFIRKGIVDFCVTSLSLMPKALVLD